MGKRKVVSCILGSNVCAGSWIGLDMIALTFEDRRLIRPGDLHAVYERYIIAHCLIPREFMSA